MKPFDWTLRFCMAALVLVACILWAPTVIEIIDPPPVYMGECRTGTYNDNFKHAECALS